MNAHTVLPPQDSGELVVTSFANLASAYDQFTAQDDYDTWGDVLGRLAHVHGAPSGTSALDLACGTGKSTLQLLRMGFQVEGCDISPAMLDQAAAKPALNGTELFVADMRDLPRTRGPYGLINAMDDAVNFLNSVEELGATLRGVRDLLRPGGLLLFDCNTLSTYRGWYSKTQVVPGDGSVYIWHGLTAPDLPPGGTGVADLYVLHHDSVGRTTWARSHHRQTHFPIETTGQELAAAGMEWLAVYGLCSTGELDGAPNEDVHGKVIHVARRPSSC